MRHGLARGIVYGLALSIPLWLILAATIVTVIR